MQPYLLLRRRLQYPNRTSRPIRWRRTGNWRQVDSWLFKRFRTQIQDHKPVIQKELLDSFLISLQAATTVVTRVKPHDYILYIHILLNPFINRAVVGRKVVLAMCAALNKSYINPLTPELNPSAQRCLTRFCTGEFASWTVHFVNMCLKNQQMQQLFIQFINYVWYLLHVSALHCHPQGALLVPPRGPWRWQCNAETCRSYHT
jgi:hypothetical protein